MKSLVAYYSPFDDCLHLRDNPDGEGCLSAPYATEGSLAGYGFPPCCPSYQKANAGGGQMPLQMTAVNEAEVKAINKADKDTSPTIREWSRKHAEYLAKNG